MTGGGAAGSVATEHSLPATAGQLSLQWSKFAPFAVSVMIVDGKNSQVHVAPQLMPAGELVIDPFPETATVTDTAFLKSAAANFAASIVSVQVGPFAAAQSPNQPANR